MAHDRLPTHAAPTYRLASVTDVRRTIDEVRPWLIEPDLLRRWVIGVQSASWTSDGAPAVGAELRVTSGTGRMNFTLVGTLIELSATTVAKRYVLDSARPADQLRFDRTVRFELAPTAHGTRVSATVDVAIEGLPRSVVGRSARVEQRALERSLDRLRLLAAGRRRGLLARLRDGGQSPQVL